MDDRDRYLRHSYTESRDLGRKEHERQDFTAALHDVADASRPDLGDRVRITGVMNDPDPIPVGTQGTVDWLGQWVNELTKQIGVKWDNGRRLLLLPGDPFEIVTKTTDS